MKFLIDNQLPHSLVQYFKSHGIEASHVLDLQLDEAADRDIWNFAAENHLTITSKDEDFFHLSGLIPDGPAVVWVRLGNCRKPALFAALDKVLTELLDELSKGARMVEVW